MTSEELMQTLQAAGMVLGVLLSIPTIIALIKVSMFIGDLRTTVKTTADQLSKFIEHVDAAFINYDVRFQENERKVNILWDGRERREGGDRREGHK